MYDALRGFAKPTTIAKALGGAKKSGSGWLARCPCHDDHGPSLSLDEGDDGKLLVHCFANCNPRDVLAELRRRGLDDQAERQQREQQRRPSPVTGRAKVERVLALCQPIRGTVVETYLREFRRVDLPPAEDALRYLPPRPPRYPHPAMVAVVTDITDAARAMTVQFTFLRSDGMGKASDDRPFLSGCPARGGVVRLVDDAEITDRLGLAEGVESALAVMSGFARSNYVVPPVWSALSAGNLARLPVLPGIEVLNIFADGDSNGIGQRAARELARTWHAAGREVLVASRPEGGDWNDA
jgi:putative DNA primase/helicase